MMSRERVLRAIEFRRPDRLPISHAVLPAAQIKYGRALDEILAEFREDFGWDYLPDQPAAEFSPQYRQGLSRDEKQGCRPGWLPTSRTARLAPL